MIKRILFLFLLIIPVKGIAGSMVSYPVQFAPYNNITAATQIMDQQIIEVADVDSLRIFFDTVDMGPTDVVVIKSLLDGKSMNMTMEDILHWQGTTPYFNGNKVEVTLIADAGSQASGLTIEEIEVNKKVFDPAATICDGKDTRKLSSDKFAGRMLQSINGTAPCSATLIANNCMISAGHCISYLRVVEFNTPISVNKKLVHPDPKDQYMIDQNSIKYLSRGIGNDWAVFKVTTNTKSNKYPEFVQGGYIQVNYNVPMKGDMVQITGYGADTEAETNFAQQTSFGPLFRVGNANDAYLNYRSDTTGGNSGSGVRMKDNQTLIGVHTHGGCTNSANSANAGTSLALNADFQAAVKACLEGK